MTTLSRHNHSHDTPDPITGAPGANPLGVGLGATSGGLAGAVAGSIIAGPVGTIAGAAIGAIAGAIAGKNAAESYDPVVEEAYWHQHFVTRPYVDQNASFCDYEPAYRYGWESASLHPDRSFEECAAELEAGWENARHGSNLTWSQARFAAQDAWEHSNNVVVTA